LVGCQLVSLTRLSALGTLNYEKLWKTVSSCTCNLRLRTHFFQNRVMRHPRLVKIEKNTCQAQQASHEEN
jgi:hypothetical protein